MAKTGQNLVDAIRRWLGDDDATTANRALTDAQLIGFLNERAQAWQQIHHDRVAGVDATTGGLTFAQGDTNKTTSTSNIAEILSVHREAASTGGPSNNRLEVLKLWELQARARQNTTQGTPTACALHRAHIEPSAVSGQGKWTVFVHPVPDATTYLSLRVRLELTDLSTADLTWILDMSNADAMLVARCAAWDAALRTGMDQQWRADFLQSIPDTERKDFDLMERETRPRGAPNIQPA